MITRLAAAAPAAALLLATATAPASAAPAGVHCSGGTLHGTLTPGISHAPTNQTLLAEATGANCHMVDLPATPALVRFTINASGNGECVPDFGITNLQATAAITITVHSLPTTNHFSGAGSMTASGVVFQGFVTDGPHADQQVNMSARIPDAALLDGGIACLLGGFKDFTAAIGDIAIG
ncbi:hypothetical protein [Kutzneria kofuensis]|uniref:Uncharacterized protein n=1 Tax=Kutzneria kofuensis TaxID=103725 RepID=A0A7W9KEF0_9PSEU|nr:hypothetical protein [Kutzneria kofuensis]MBB5891026.1 hypothetical protein [Kutzneria kofuensis]